MAKYYYNNTSEAYKLTQPEVKPDVKKVRKVKKNTKVVTRYKYEMDKAINFSPLTYLFVSVIFIGGISLLAFNATLTNKLLAIKQLTNYHNALKQSNEAELLALNNYNLTEIEQVARLKLGMDKPQAHQIVKIKVPKGNYTEQYAPEKNLNKANVPNSSLGK